MSVEIVDLFGNGITFRAEDSMSPYGAGINLLTTQTEFTIYNGQAITLVTPTMDYGEIYRFEYNRSSLSITTSYWSGWS